MTLRPGLTMGAWLRRDAIRRALGRARPSSVLEVGPGLGAMAARLAPRFDYTGIEMDDESYRASSAVLDELGVGRVYHGSFEVLGAGAAFDLVCAFEVLEHIEDDVAALEDWVTRLVDRGHVLISVPSGPERFGPTDAMVGHFRRYTRDGIEAVFDRCGLDLLSAEEWGLGLGHGLEAARNRIASRGADARTVEERTKASGRFLQPTGGMHVVANAVVSAPFRLLQYPFRNTDVGIGLVALGRRRP